AGAPSPGRPRTLPGFPSQSPGERALPAADRRGRVWEPPRVPISTTDRVLADPARATGRGTGALGRQLLRGHAEALRADGARATGSAIAVASAWGATHGVHAPPVRWTGGVRAALRPRTEVGLAHTAHAAVGAALAVGGSRAQRMTEAVDADSV